MAESLIPSEAAMPASLSIKALTPPWEIIGRAIQRTRTKASMTIPQLAKATRLSEGTIQDLEDGKPPVKPERVIKIADALQAPQLIQLGKDVGLLDAGIRTGLDNPIRETGADVVVTKVADTSAEPGKVQ